MVMALRQTEKHRQAIARQYTVVEFVHAVIICYIAMRMVTFAIIAACARSGRRTISSGVKGAITTFVGTVMSSYHLLSVRQVRRLGQ